MQDDTAEETALLQSKQAADYIYIYVHEMTTITQSSEICTQAVDTAVYYF